jgi:multiple sugar transport system ATP-binding protein
MARVQFEHVSKRFKHYDPDKKQHKQNLVVNDVSLDIQDKEFLVLVGGSGCGKSTSLRMIAGLDEPTEGNIYIGDRLVNGVDPKDRDIAMVFQNYALYPHMTVYDNISFGLRLRHVPKAEIHRRVIEAADILGLQSELKKHPKELSGGQRQRVALGRAMVRHAQVFLLDEPLSNLDAKLRVHMRAELIKIHQRMQTTTIYVTHDQVEAMTMGDRIALLGSPRPDKSQIDQKGKILQLGSPQDLYDHPVNMYVAGFIGSPSMNFIPSVRVFGDNNATYIILEGIGRVLVPELYADRARTAAGRNLTFGIRPIHLEDARIAGAERGLQSVIDATVDVVENLGSELQVYLTTGSHSIVATLDHRSPVVAGNKIRLAVDNSQIHLFDTDTEVAIF